MAKLLVVFVATIAVVLGAKLQPRVDSNGNGRVVGGSDAPDGAYPYQITMKDRNGAHACGGSIIAPTIIVTAAHCVTGVSPSSLTVVVGTNKLNSGGTKYAVAQIVQHERYNRNTAEHDIALLKLSSPIEYTTTVAAIELETEEIELGATVTLTGWGKTSHPGSSPNNLQHIDLKTIDNTECALSHIFLRPVFKTQICTLTRYGEGACHGDSGGPLACNGKLVGIVSWGRPCAVGSPDVFTKVSSYIDWIQENSK